MAKNERADAPADAPATSAARAAESGSVRIQWQPSIKGINQRFEDGGNTWESNGFTPAVAEVDLAWWAENQDRLRKDADGKFSEVTEG